MRVAFEAAHLRGLGERARDSGQPHARVAALRLEGAVPDGVQHLVRVRGGHSLSSTRIFDMTGLILFRFAT